MSKGEKEVEIRKGITVTRTFTPDMDKMVQALERVLQIEDKSEEEVG